MGNVKINAVRLQKDIATKAQKELDGIIGQATKHKVVTKIFEELCRPYVPMGNPAVDYEYYSRNTPGTLKADVDVTEKQVTWGNGAASAYARYVYEGEIYGPNYFVPVEKIPGSDNKYDPAGLWGWRSPAGKDKYPTGRMMEYTYTSESPLASRHWDKAMLRDKRGILNQRVTKEIKRIARKRGKL